MEVSSSQRDYYARGRPDLISSVIGVMIGGNRKSTRDPQMVSLLGQFVAGALNRQYGFHDEMQEIDIEILKHRVGTWKMLGKKGQKEQKGWALQWGGIA
jgi:hypothetical protein